MLLNKCKGNGFHFAYISEASLGPYAWESTLSAPKKMRRHEPATTNLQNLPVQEDASGETMGRVVSTPMFKDVFLEHEELAALPRSQNVFRKIELDSYVSLRLPKPNATAGTVLKHSCQVFEQLLQKHKPMTFKFGITHDPCVRWHNVSWGYKVSKDPFQHTLVIYSAGNPHGPAFLEASLIDRYGSFLVASISYYVFFLPV